MGSLKAGGLGEIAHAHSPAFMARYRFFFNPIRCTSMGSAVIAAMMSGLLIATLRTTEMATVIRNDVSGYADINPRELDRACGCC